MKFTKSIFLFLSNIFLIITLINAATFSVTYTNPEPLTISNTETSFNLINNGPQNINLVVILPPTISDNKGHQIIITSPSQLIFNNISQNQNTGEIKILYTGETSNFMIGEFTSNILVRAEEVGNSSNNLNLTIPLKFRNTFCKSGEKGTNLSITDVRIDNNDGEDDEWSPLDKINVKVKVENTGEDRIKNIYVELGLYDSTGKNIVKNLEDLKDKKISLGTISEGKEETVQFDFRIPADFKEDDYFLVIKAYKSGEESEICTSSSSDLSNFYYHRISGVRETEVSKQIVLTDLVLSPEKAQCGEKVQVTGRVVNIGDEDYQDQVEVTLYNRELGLNLEKTLTRDFDQGDSDSVDFEFDVPKNSTEKVYTLEFRTYYDYLVDEDKYDITSDQKFTIPLKVEGNCVQQSLENVDISAELSPDTPEAIAGKQVIIKTNLKNLGNSPTTYSISIFGNSPWSSLVSIEPQTLTLNKGESGESLITLNIDNNVEGEKEFTIKATYGGKVTEKKVLIFITKPEVQFNKIIDHLKRNWFIYLIILANLILVIAIIIVIRRMISSPSKVEEYAY